jgi:hypothetical protein
MRYLRKQHQKNKVAGEMRKAKNALLASGTVEVAPAEGEGGELSAKRREDARVDCEHRVGIAQGEAHLSMTASNSFALGNRSGTWRASKFFM